jgi:uncharacterized membrane protein YjfL (UPF0719 family)
MPSSRACPWFFRADIRTRRCFSFRFVVYSRRPNRMDKEEIVAQLLLGLAQLAIAVILSAIAAYLAFYLFQWFTRNLDEWEELRQGNPAVGIVLGAIVISVAIVLRPALVVNTTLWDAGRDLYLRVLLAEALQLAVGLVLAVITLALALYLFAGLTRGIDEVEELKKGNLAIAGLLAGVAVAVGLLVSQAVGEIMALVSSLLL